MKQTNASQPAFPGTWEEEHETRKSSYKVTRHDEGMSMLEYYAGKAMQGYIIMQLNREIFSSPEQVAQQSVLYAKALIAELNENFREEQEALRKEREQYRLDHPDEPEDF